MGALTAWMVSIVVVIAGILVLAHLGLNVIPGIAAAVHEAVRFLARPL
ncbi:MAG: hypothetical protein QXG65_01190 [Thermoplasmata archaeon]